MTLPTIADLKQHLDITTSTDDGELQSILEAAIDVVAGIVGPLSQAPVTETHYGVFGFVVVTRRVPVSSLTDLSTRWYPGADWSPQSVADYELDTDTGAIRSATGLLFRGDVRITYTAGYDVIPAAVSLATLVIAGQLWETQRGAMPLPANSTDDDISADVHFAPAIPNRAKTLLEPFALGPQVA